MTAAPPPLDWTLDVDVPVGTELHRVIRRTLEVRARDRRPVQRAVRGALSSLLARPLPLRGVLHGDTLGVARVSVDLPRGTRHTLRLVAAAVPSRWRWRSEGEALVGRGPRTVTPVACEAAPADCVVTLAFAFPDDLEELVLEGLPSPVRGLRRGEVVLRDVTPDDAEVRWRLRFDTPALARAAAPTVNALLARIALEHAEHELRYEGDWTTEGSCVVGAYRGTAT
ncbi:MAG: hypothetical protein AAF211_23220, partial [Myxococcota bacterium]